MAKFLAIDWDETECRYAIATLHNEKIIVRNVGIVPITLPIGGNASESPLMTLARTIHSLSKEEKLGNCPLLLSLGRNDVEWIQQKLPPCKKSEIPLLLKNQVLREVPGSTESDPLDYLVLESSSDGHQILALTISLAFRKSLVRIFRSLGYPPLHIGFRAGNAAELALRNTALIDSDPSEPCLIVNTVGNDVDLIVVAEERIAALRSFRLPVEHWHKNLADEIERTLTIGLEGAASLSVRHVVLFGDGTDTKLQGYLSRCGLTVQFLNPFTLPNVSVSNEVADPGKFAPLIGSLVIQTQKVKSVIDFLHPKEAPKSANYARPILLSLLLLGIVCFGLYYWNQNVIGRMQKRLAEVKTEHQQVADALLQLQPSWNVQRQTYFWESQNVVWLDVLKELSEVLPNSTDLVVAQMTLTTGTTNNNPRYSSTITLTGMVRDPSVLQKLQSDLQLSGRYWVQNPAPSPNPAGGGYPWLFRTTIYRLRL